MTGSGEQAIQKRGPGIKPRGSQLALYGGAFDPIHRAHLAIAGEALHCLEDAEVCFIPAAHSPLKQAGPVAGDAQRLEMLARALGGEPRFLLDDLEIRRGGRSYTVETVSAFARAFPGVELFWIVGADQFEQLDRWAQIDRLIAEVTFLVAGRPGHSLGEPPVQGLRYRKIDVSLMDLSSSEVRKRCQAGSGISELVPEQIEAFISKHGLYTSGQV